MKLSRLNLNELFTKNLFPLPLPLPQLGQGEELVQPEEPVLNGGVVGSGCLGKVLNPNGITVAKRQLNGLIPVKVLPDAIPLKTLPRNGGQHQQGADQHQHEQGADQHQHQHEQGADQHQHRELLLNRWLVLSLNAGQQEVR